MVVVLLGRATSVGHPDALVLEAGHGAGRRVAVLQDIDGSGRHDHCRVEHGGFRPSGVPATVSTVSSARCIVYEREGERAVIPVPDDGAVGGADGYDEGTVMDGGACGVEQVLGVADVYAVLVGAERTALGGVVPPVAGGLRVGRGRSRWLVALAGAELAASPPGVGHVARGVLGVVIAGHGLVVGGAAIVEVVRVGFCRWR